MDSRGHQVFFVKVVVAALIGQGARRIHTNRTAESRRSSGKITASERWIGSCGYWHGARNAIRAVVQIEGVLVEGHFGALAVGVKIGDRCRLKLRRRDENLYRIRQHIAQTFVVIKEKQFVLLDGATDGTCPLVAIGKRAWRSVSVAEIVVSIQSAAIPQPHR